MAKKHMPEKNNHLEEVDIIIESQQWESPAPPPRFTWRHALVLAIILGVGILFAFGFLIIAGLVLMATIIINLVLFIVRKLT